MSGRGMGAVCVDVVCVGVVLWSFVLPSRANEQRLVVDICVHVYVCVYLYVCVCMYVCLCVCMCVCINVCIFKVIVH